MGTLWINVVERTRSLWLWASPTAKKISLCERDGSDDEYHDCSSPRTREPTSPSAKDLFGADDVIKEKYRSTMSTRASGGVSSMGSSLTSQQRDSTATLLIPPSSLSFVDANITTVVIRNLNRSITLVHFVAMLDKCGFKGTYDFAHLPFRVEKKKYNLGFAFVNFLHPNLAQLLSDNRHILKELVGKKSRKLSIVPSEVQGRAMCIERIMDSLKDPALYDPSYHPTAFVDENIVSYSFVPTLY